MNLGPSIVLVSWVTLLVVGCGASATPEGASLFGATPDPDVVACCLSSDGRSPIPPGDCRSIGGSLVPNETCTIESGDLVPNAECCEAAGAPSLARSGTCLTPRPLADCQP